MKWIPKFFGRLWITFKTSLKIFTGENNFRYSAAFSFYTIFSLAPLLIITISVCGYFFGKQAMEGKIFSEIRSLVGDVAARQIQQMLQLVISKQGSLVTKVIWVSAMIFSITSLFSEVQDAFNCIWKLKTQPKLNWKKYVIKRLISFGLFCVTGLILVLLLLLNWLIDVFGVYLGHFFKDHSVFMVFVSNQVVITTIVALLFTFLFKYLPDGKVKWKDAIWGAVFTSIFFILGKAFIGYYLVHAHMASMYGAAGGLVVLLLWIYYLSVILYFGTTFTKTYAYLYGGKIIPEPFAVKL